LSRVSHRNSDLVARWRHQVDITSLIEIMTWPSYIWSLDTFHLPLRINEFKNRRSVWSFTNWPWDANVRVLEDNRSRYATVDLPTAILVNPVVHCLPTGHGLFNSQRRQQVSYISRIVIVAQNSCWGLFSIVCRYRKERAMLGVFLSQCLNIVCRASE
jgi:hypothetical protein